MTSTVEFQAAFGACVKDHPNTVAIVEIGPHTALKGPAEESLHALGKSSVEYLPTCLRRQNDFEVLLSTVGILIGIGLQIQPSNINAREVVDGLQCYYEPCNVLTDAPSYQWNHSQRFWAESRVSCNVRFRKFPRHQLLGPRYVDDIPNHPSWRNQLTLKEIPWLQEVKVRNMLAMRHPC